MKLELISEDRDLYKLCREVTSEIPGPSWTVSVVAASGLGEDADLWLWDYSHGITLPQEIANCPSRHLFLVGRQDVAEFLACTGVTDTHILLKPATRATLGTLLGVAAAQGDRQGGT